MIEAAAEGQSSKFSDYSEQRGLLRRFLVPRRASTACLVLFAAALAIRLAVMPFLYKENLDPERDHWMFGHEQGRVARSIVLGHGFANPLFGPTGSTAYAAPVYPYLMAAVFAIFGVYTKASAIVIIALNCLFSALVAVPLYCSARRSFGNRTALIAGWFWVIFPYSVYWTIMRIWDTWITTFLISVLFLLTLQLARSESTARWAGFGLLCGFTALVNPVALSIVPGLLLWTIYGLHRQGRHWFLQVCTALLCVCGVLAPWMVRNYVVLHKFIPVRDSLGLELYVGNDGNDTGLYDIQAGPWKNTAEWQRFQEIGELAYFGEKGKVAIGFIKAHPKYYALKCLRRLVNVWTDFWSLSREFLEEDPYSPVVALLCTILSLFTLLGLRRTFQENPFDAPVYASVLVLYPLVYCFTHTAEWYRRPIDPFFVILAAHWLGSILKGRSESGIVPRVQNP